MKVSAADEELVDLIYAALLGESSWQAFSDRLSARLPDGKTVMFLHKKGLANEYFALNSGFDDSALAAYASYYSTVNPFMPPSEVRRVGIGVVGEQAVASETIARSEYFNDFLLPNGAKSTIGVTINREEDCSFILTTITSRADPNENLHFADLLTRLAPHLRRASDFYRNGTFARLASELGGSLFDAEDRGLVLVGEAGRVKAISRAGEAMIASSSPAYITAFGRFGFRDEAPKAALDQMLERNYAGPKVVNLHCFRTKVTLVRIMKDRMSLYFAGPTVLVVLKPYGASVSNNDVRHFSQAYGLTAAEARAFAGLLLGKSIDDIARDASVSRETIRSQVKSLYAKTGVHGEAELMRLARS